jgi:hypothetical protein
MSLFQSWWERAPSYVRIALFAAAIVATIFGGSATGYWE